MWHDDIRSNTTHEMDIEYRVHTLHSIMIDKSSFFFLFYFNLMRYWTNLSKGKLI